MSASPQCQMRMPGLVAELTQSGSRPGGLVGPQAVVGTLLVRFGGLVQPSTQTTLPDRSYGLVGQPG